MVKRTRAEITLIDYSEIVPAAFIPELLLATAGMPGENGSVLRKGRLYVVKQYAPPTPRRFKPKVVLTRVHRRKGTLTADDVPFSVGARLENLPLRPVGPALGSFFRVRSKQWKASVSSIWNLAWAWKDDSMETLSLRARAEFTPDPTMLLATSIMYATVPKRRKSVVALFSFESKSPLDKSTMMSIRLGIACSQYLKGWIFRGFIDRHAINRLQRDNQVKRFALVSYDDKDKVIKRGAE